MSLCSHAPRKRAAAWAAALLALAAAQASAQTSSPPAGPPPVGLEKDGWTLITASDSTYVYMRPAGAAEGGIRRAWTAYDSEQPRERQGFSFRSVQSLGEFDCRRKLSRVIEETFHAAPQLQGEVWRQPDFIPTDWAAPEPGSVGAIRMAFACKALVDS
jgi:hypothetical protein